MSKSQAFDGYGGDNFKRCAQPETMISTNTECERVHLVMKVAENVIAGLEDPYHGQGNSQRSGVFYFMTKGDLATRKRKQAEGKKVWIPKHDPLPALNGSKDIHVFWGLDEEAPYKP
jgi:hypothetical protein